MNPMFKPLVMGENPTLELLFEDPCLLVVNKPAGQLFQGRTLGLPSTLDAQVKAHIRTSKAGSPNVYLGIVQRLDRPVSGIVLFGKNSKFTARLSQQFQARSVEKRYVAFLEGNLLDEAGELVSELDNERSGTKVCRLNFKVLHRLAGMTCVQIHLGTGRRNQIRKQFSLIGHPLIGDLKFGAKAPFPGFEDTEPLFRPIALHAESLRFQHPKTENPMQICAPRPLFWQVLDKSEAAD